MPARRGSLDTILDEVRSERTAQVRHFDALDAKAGIILGFSGVLVALFPAGGVLIDAGRATAVGSGLLALWTFWPRLMPELNLPSLKQLYARAEPEFTSLRLIDTHTEALETLRVLVEAKVIRLKLSMSALAVATTLASIGLVVD